MTVQIFRELTLYLHFHNQKQFMKVTKMLSYLVQKIQANNIREDNFQRTIWKLAEAVKKDEHYCTIS